MFQSTTKKIVKEIDPYGSTLIPLASPYHSQHCKPLHLLIKKKKSLFSRQDRYVPTSFKLTDILMDGQDLDFGLSSSSFACYSEEFSSSASGEVNVDAGNIESGAHASGSASRSMSAVEMKKQIISENILLDVIGNRKVNREHNFMKQLMDNIVYIVSGVIETEKPCTVNRTSKAESGVKILTKLLKVESGLSASREKKLTFPAGTTIAYKVSELMITLNDTLELNFGVMLRNALSGLFHNQKETIAASIGELKKLSADKRLLLLNVILENLCNNENLPVLDEMLDQMCEGLQPDLQVLDLLEESSRVCVEKMLDLLGIKKADPPGQPLTLTQDQERIIEAVNILIQSLNEMEPENFVLLATSVKAKIIPKQLELAKIIDDKWSQGPRLQIQQTCDMEDPEKTLIAQLTDEEFEITQQMLEESGFQMNRENSSVSRVEGREHRDVLPLFTTLCALSALSA
ncbi:uncharacterized protein LOC127582903 [Pristis pectinata]|uniref:uncharacterized protein LOC127582903 n=1 Tax=Pristis pectinata TaxID=685728 RepID=UPI00223E6084|nr:uncharacterized protein LOC127582903 [Pristis pectinata]